MTKLGKLLRKEFDQPQNPSLPIKRLLTEEENNLMHKHYHDYSWRPVDANDRILLGCGEEGKCIYYITVQDLAKLD